MSKYTVSFTEIMSLRDTGEVSEAYVASNDEVGYFAPTDELRIQIKNTFGG